jgi:hypothetical protein
LFKDPNIKKHPAYKRSYRFPKSDTIVYRSNHILNNTPSTRQVFKTCRVYFLKPPVKSALPKEQQQDKAIERKKFPKNKRNLSFVKTPLPVS